MYLPKVNWTITIYIFFLGQVTDAKYIAIKKVEIEFNLVAQSLGIPKHYQRKKPTWRCQEKQVPKNLFKSCLSLESD